LLQLDCRHEIDTAIGVPKPQTNQKSTGVVFGPAL